jgi:pimeloyl-ACP methyl ester carboxylesterase
MRALLEIFAFNQALVSDDLAEVRYRASVESGVQEAFSSMFPAPRQRWVDALATPEADIKKISNKTLIVHGHDDQVIPLQNAYRLLALIPTSDLVVFGQCGHWTQIERTDQFNQLVLDFLTRPAA